MSPIVVFAILMKKIKSCLTGIANMTKGSDNASIDITTNDGGKFNIPIPKSTTTKEIVSTVDCGAIKKGDKVKINSDIQALSEQLLLQDESCSVILTLTCSDGDTHDIVREKGVNIDVNAKVVVTKKSYDISTGSWTAPNTISETVSSTGGTYTRDFNNISDTTVFTFKATDIKGLVGSASKQIDFVDPIYVCYIDKTTDIADVTESMIKGGTKVLKKKGIITEDIISANQKVGFCFPKSYGLLTSVRDVKNSFENLDSFDVKEIDITSIDGRTLTYYLYLNSLAVTLDASDKFQYQLKW